MNAVGGTYEQGRVKLDESVDWAEGQRVNVDPVVVGWGLLETGGPGTSLGCDELLSRIDRLEPLDLTPEEQSEIDAARRAVRDVSVDAVRRRMGRRQ